MLPLETHADALRGVFFDLLQDCTVRGGGIREGIDQARLAVRSWLKEEGFLIRFCLLLHMLGIFQ